MPTTLGQWVNQALQASGKSQAQLAEDMGAVLQAPMDRSKVNKIVLDKRKMSADEMLAISEITGAALPNELSQASVSIAGKVGAGALVPVFDAYEKGDGPQVECPPGLNPHGVVAVEVEGDSMEPAFSDGDILFYTRVSDNGVPEEAIGAKCVCEDQNAMGWVKQIKRGTEPGLFNLISLNPTAENQHDIKLKWAARVRLHWPAELVKKI